MIIRFKDLLKDAGIATKMLFFLFVICFCVVLISPAILGINALKLPEITQLKLIQLVSSVGLSILPVYIYARRFSTKPLSYLSLTTKTNWKIFIYVALVMIIAVPFINLIGDINQHMVLPKAFAGVETWMKDAELKASDLTEKMMNIHSIYSLLFNILLVAIIPAIGEELVFRGVIIKTVKDWKGIYFAIWLSAIIFSAIHIQFYGFIPRMLMGAFFGYLLFWSDSLWLPIVAHFTNNVFAIIFYFLKFNGYHVPDIDSVGTGDTLWMGIASGALVIFGIFQLKKQILLKRN